MKRRNGTQFPVFIQRRSRAMIGPVLGLTLTLGLTGHPVAGAEHMLTDRNGLTALSQLVKHFDFEEAEQAPFEMPLNFYRYGADEGGIGHGFPPFGTMRLTREVAHSGNWSFKFELDGGSMAARIPTAVIPVMPGADYTIATQVKTDGLTHARARLVAWLYDEYGEIIPESRSESRLVDTRGAWQVLAVPVRGRFEQATDLGIELQLLQPNQFARNAGDPYAPTPADVTGRAYFDDVSVWQQPRIMITTDRPGNVIVDPHHPRLVIEVHDVVHQNLDAQLRVYDVTGESVFEDRFSAPRSPKQREIDLPLDRFGWYRASLGILLDGELAAHRWVDLAYLPQPRRVAIGQHHRFTLTLPESWPQHGDVLPELIRRLGVGTVIIPILSRSMTKENARQWYQQSRQTIEHLRSEHIELTFSLDSIPEELASELDLGPADVLLGLQREPAVWRDYLDDLIVNYSFEVPRWQLGESGSDNVAWIDNAPHLIEQTLDGLRRLVPGGSVLIPTVAHHVPRRLPEHAAYHVTLPYHIRPQSIEPFTEQWLETGRRREAMSVDVDETDLLFHIESMPQGTYSPDQRAIDLMLRVLYAWRGGARDLSIKPPWTSSVINGAEIMPQETLPIWNQLIDQLRGRRIVGMIEIGQGYHCWLLAGVDRDDAAMVVWSEPGTGRHDEGSSFQLQLADGPVTVTDGFGNHQTVPLRGDAHLIAVEQMPRFVEGINLELVQFRGGFSVDPDFLPVEARIHEHELVLRNPWPMPINGTLRMHEKEGMTFSPRSHRFSIPAEDEVRLPIEIQLTRSVLAGTKRIKADVSLTADGQYDLTLSRDVTVGLNGIDFAATSRARSNPDTGENDLVITQYITNTGRQPVNVEAFMLGRGVPHERRLIAGLNPGEMAIRIFTIPDGANLLAGQRVRVGIIERDGVARLNKMIDVPAR